MTQPVLHPTKQLLITAAVELLDANPGERVLVDDVLAHSQISRGSLYHHFSDFNDLVEAALLVQFTRFVDAGALWMTSLLGSVTSASELRQALFAITVESQSDKYAASRLLRTRILGEADGNEGFKAKLQGEVDRLTDTLADLIQEAINRGWFRDRFDARTIALFIQAYSLGKVLNDVSAEKVSEDQWNLLINSIICDLFIND